jgi:hypothetical protein
MLDEDKIAQLVGAKLVAGSDEVGEIEEVYAHSSDNLPALVAVRAANGTVLVPLPESEISEGRVAVPFGADAIAGAPAPSGDVIAEDEFEQVYAHFGISDARMREDTGLGRTGRADQGMSRDPRGGSAADDSSQRHP